MAINYSFRSDFVEIYIEDGILWVVYGKNVKITEDKARIIVAERLKVANGKAYPTLADCRKGNSIDKASRAVFASVDAMKNVTAGAILFGNPIHRMFIKSYLFFDRPKVPTEVFSDELMAIKWLQLLKVSPN